MFSEIYLYFLKKLIAYLFLQLNVRCDYLTKIKPSPDTKYINAKQLYHWRFFLALAPQKTSFPWPTPFNCSCMPTIFTMIQRWSSIIHFTELSLNGCCCVIAVSHNTLLLKQFYPDWSGKKWQCQVYNCDWIIRLCKE